MVGVCAQPDVDLAGPFGGGGGAAWRGQSSAELFPGGQPWPVLQN